MWSGLLPLTVEGKTVHAPNMQSASSSVPKMGLPSLCVYIQDSTFPFKWDLGLARPTSTKRGQKRKTPQSHQLSVSWHIHRGNHLQSALAQACCYKYVSMHQVQNVKQFLVRMLQDPTPVHHQLVPTTLYLMRSSSPESGCQWNYGPSKALDCEWKTFKIWLYENPVIKTFA